MGWNKNDTLIFQIPIKDSLSLYHLTAEVRSSDLYPYKDLYLVINNNFKSKDNFVSDTIQFILADSIGRRSEQGWSCLYQMKQSLYPVFVKDTGNYIVKINHIMRDQNLTGLHDIGIKLSK